MSNQSNPPRSNGPRPIKLQPERMPPTIASPHQLAQFTAAAASGYSPRPQMPTSAYNTPPSREPDAHITTAPVPQATTTPTPQATATPVAQPSSTPAAQSPATPATSTTSAQPTTTASSAASSGSSSVQATRAEITSYVDGLNRSPIKPLRAQPINDFDQFKGFKFVSLLGLIIDVREIYEKVSGTFEWEMCESQIDRCEKYIKEKCKKRRVFLLVSGALGKEIVPKVHDLPNVYAIYVFCSDLSYHIPWATKHSKVRVICNDDTEHLVPRLAIDVAQSNIDWGNEYMKKGDREGAKEKFSDAKKNLDSEFCKKADSNMKTEVDKQLEKLK